MIRSTTSPTPARAGAKPAVDATGENLFSMQDARNLVRYGGMGPRAGFLQLIPPSSYGLVEYLRTLCDAARCPTAGQPSCIPHGGHQMSLAIAAGLGLGGLVDPDLFQPYGGFPDGVKVDNSYVMLPELPGIGFEGKSDLYREMHALAH